jgi:hypothetical protein
MGPESPVQDIDLGCLSIKLVSGKNLTPTVSRILWHVQAEEASLRIDQQRHLEDRHWFEFIRRSLGTLSVLFTDPEEFPWHPMRPSHVPPRTNS